MPGLSGLGFFQKKPPAPGLYTGSEYVLLQAVKLRIIRERPAGEDLPRIYKYGCGKNCDVQPFHRSTRTLFRSEDPEIKISCIDMNF
ncbi:hypothetical protein HMPREF3213_03219 [Heyndrickxia coagulans]|jgi:hypothetical protein|uniref:Uncharacterized protein n=1 Tax=Heyndrickxia coagulans TaxID=1398 RepID=A0A133KE08_HEYCO|nr:hypothetical protein HMPREF3213_03219 [Heyndrickxia coagulans]